MVSTQKSANIFWVHRLISQLAEVELTNLLWLEVFLAKSAIFEIHNIDVVRNVNVQRHQYAKQKLSAREG